MSWPPATAVGASPWTTWTPAPLVLALAAAAIVFFLHGWRRLRARGRPDLAPRNRLVLFSAGVGVSLIATVSPIDAVGERYLQSAHMIQHVLLADVGVALIVLALRGPLAVFFLPRNLLAPLSRNRPLRRMLAWLLRPSVTITLWLAVLVAWHIPLFYEASLRNRPVHDLEHLSFAVVGTLLWVQLIDPTNQRRLTLTRRVGLAALVFWLGQLLALALVFAPSPLYDIYVDQPRRLLGIEPLTDQRIAALIMMIEQTLTLGLFFLWGLRRHRQASALARPGAGARA